MAFTELGLCLCVFAVLGGAILWVPGTSNEFAGAAPANLNHPVRRLSVCGPGRDRVAVLSDDACVVQRLDGSEGSTVWMCEDGDTRLTAVAGSPAGERLVLCRSDGGVTLVEAGRSEPVWDRTVEAGSVSSVSFSRDGRRVALGTNQGTVLLLEAETGAVAKEIETGGDVRAVGFTADGDRLVVPDPACGITLWDAASGEMTLRIPTEAQGQVITMDLERSGGALVAGTDRGGLLIVDLVGGRQTVFRKVAFEPVLAVAFAGERRVAVGTVNPEIRLYSADAGLAAAGVLEGHRRGTRGLALAGETLVSGGHDGRVVAWDGGARAGRELLAY